MANFLGWINNARQIVSSLSSGSHFTSGADKLVSTGARGVIDPSLLYDFRAGMPLWDDFTGTSSTGTLGWNITTGGSGSTTTNVSTGTGNNRMGVMSLNVSASAGRQALHGGTSAIFMGNASYYLATDVMISDLAVTGEDSFARVGLMDNLGSAADSNNGVYFHYEGVSFPNWQCKTANNSTRTRVDSGIPIVINTWYRLEIYVNGLTGVSTFYIDGSLVGTIGTNYPQDKNVSYGYFLYKATTANNSTRRLLSDFFYMNIKFNTAR